MGLLSASCRSREHFQTLSRTHARKSVPLSRVLWECAETTSNRQTMVRPMFGLCVGADKVRSRVGALMVSVLSHSSVGEIFTCTRSHAQRARRRETKKAERANTINTRQTGEQAQEWYKRINARMENVGDSVGHEPCARNVLIYNFMIFQFLLLFFCFFHVFFLLAL